jgi:hypothetical protein
LPQKGAYIAIFRGEDNIEYKSVIKGGRVKLPPELLNKEQYVSLIVTEVNDEIVVHAGVCEPLKVTAYFHLRQNQWQVSGGYFLGVVWVNPQNAVILSDSNYLTANFVVKFNTVRTD